MFISVLKMYILWRSLFSNFNFRKVIHNWRVGRHPLLSWSYNQTYYLIITFWKHTCPPLIQFCSIPAISFRREPSGDFNPMKSLIGFCEALTRLLFRDWTSVSKTVHEESRWLMQWWANIIKLTRTNIRIYLDATLCTEWISEYIRMQHIYRTNIRIYS